MNVPPSSPLDRSSSPVTPSVSLADRHDRAFFGHPAGLMTLFFAEMWERFSYYGMRAILILFMTATTVQGGLEFGKAQAGVIYALYTSMVYFAGLAGGWLADNVIGQRRAVFWGGVVIMLGHISLAFDGLGFFFAGLILIIGGTGLLKPNISTIVGLLYGSTDARRDSGFAIYYMGINIGSFLGQTVCGFLAQDEGFRNEVLPSLGISPGASWHWGFAAAAVGMFFGLVAFVWKGRLMGNAGLHPVPSTSPVELERRKKVLLRLVAGILAFGVFIGAFIVWVLHAGLPAETIADLVNLGFGCLLLVITFLSFAKIILFSGFDRQERLRLTVVLILFFASVLFWGAFEQAGGLLNLFADEKSQLDLFGRRFPSSWYQNINPFGIMLLSPLFAFLWLKAGRRAPSSPAKFSIGLFLVGLGFVVAALGSRRFDQTLERISPAWLTLVYVLHTLGELFLSPIGLSMVTKLSPQRAVSQVMSIWFLANADANFLAGQSVVLNEHYSATAIFGFIAGVTIVAGLVLVILTPPIRRMMGGVH